MVDWKPSVLVLDGDDKGSRELADTISQAGCSALWAGDESRALSMMLERDFDFLVVDVGACSGADGDIIDRAQRLNPAPKIVALGASEDPREKRKAIERGAGMFLNKPVDTSQLVHFLINRVGGGLFSGTVRGVDILDFLQFLMLTGLRTVVDVQSSEGLKGRLYLDDGKAVHAICGSETGEAAFTRIAGFPGGTFANLPWTEPPTRTIEKPGEYLLIEAARMRDESGGGADDRDAARPAGPDNPKG